MNRSLRIMLICFLGAGLLFFGVIAFLIVLLVRTFILSDYQV